MIRQVATLFLAMALAGLSPGVGSAKPLGKILRQSGLSPADFDLLGAAEMSLLEQSGVQVGQKVSWTNPETQSRGVVRMAAQQSNCAYLQHFIYPQGASKVVELRNRMCKQANGKWVLTP